MDIGMGWMVFSKTINEYNGNNQLIKETQQSYDFVSLALKNSYLRNYTYNADGTENQRIQQDWDANTSAWVISSRTTYTYSSKKATSILYEEYQGGVWINDSKETFTYNSNGTYNEILDQSWIPATSTWKNNWKEIFSYSSGNLSQIISQQWDTGSSSWVNDSRTSYTPITSINQRFLPGENLVRVYPNPFTDEIIIDNNRFTSARYQVFNSAGLLVYSIIADGNRTRLNLNSLGSGTYYLKVNSGNQIKTIKMIKMR